MLDELKQEFSPKCPSPPRTAGKATLIPRFHSKVDQQRRCPDEVGINPSIGPGMVRKLRWIIGAVVLLTGLVMPVTRIAAAHSSHTITVVVPEICRYRIERISRLPTADAESVYEVRLAVFNNSSRRWCLRVQPVTDGGEADLEWSGDGRSWQPMDKGANALLYGNKVNWGSYLIFYRYRTSAIHPSDTFYLQYQLSYQD